MRWSTPPIAACAVAAGLFGYMFHEEYWRWRDCFNELGRCYDPESQAVYLEQTGMFWGFLTAVPAISGLLLWRWTRRRTAAGSGAPPPDQTPPHAASE